MEQLKGQKNASYCPSLRSYSTLAAALTASSHNSFITVFITVLVAPPTMLQ